MEARCSQLGSHTRPCRCQAALGISGWGFSKPCQKSLLALPSGPTGPEFTLEWGKVLYDNFPADPPPPSFLPRRANQTLRSSWVSGESGNKGKESHFLSRGRKEVESRPVSQPESALGRLQSLGGDVLAAWNSPLGLKPLQSHFLASLFHTAPQSNLSLGRELNFAGGGRKCTFPLTSTRHLTVSKRLGGVSLILFPTPEKEEAQSWVLPHRGSHWVTLMKSPNLSGPGFLVIK